MPASATSLILVQLVAQELKAAKLMEETKKEEELQRQKEAAKLQEAKERCCTPNVTCNDVLNHHLGRRYGTRLKGKRS